MVYISKRRNFKSFLQNRNLKYYLAVLLLFLVAIAVIIVISKRKTSDNNDKSDASETTTTPEASDSSDSEASIGKYKLSINLDNCQITVYPYNADTEDYGTVPYKYMLCSINKQITEGSYTSKSDVVLKNTWLNSTTEAGVAYRYVSDFGNDIAFHSAGYSRISDKNSLVVDYYNSIGGMSDYYGITLLVSDAKWIYENCASDSEIVIYSDADEKISDIISSLINIPAGITWEPTDSSTGTPWCPVKVKSLDCPAQIDVSVNFAAEMLRSFATALDDNNNNANTYVYVTGSYDVTKPGTYTITFNFIDKFGGFLQKSSQLVVNEQATTQEETTTITETTAVTAQTTAPAEETNSTEETTAETTTTETEPTTSTEEEN